VDPNPNPKKINSDPQHWVALIKKQYTLINILDVFMQKENFYQLIPEAKKVFELLNGAYMF
jgi:hypothetical protein